MKEFIKYPKFFLLLTAIWPVKNTKINSLYNIRSFVFSYLLAITFSISIAIETTKPITDLQKWTDTALFGITEINFMIKFTLFIINRNKFIKLLKYINLAIFSENIFHHSTSFQKWLQFAYLYCCGFYITCLSCCVFYSIYPLFDDNKFETLPFRVWLPFDQISNKFVYICVYVFQVSSLFVCTINNASLDLLPSVVMNIACLQLDVLKENLEGIIQKATHETDSCVMLTERENRVVLKMLGQCVKHHNAIIKLIKNCEEVFTTGIFFQFATSTLVLCITGFTILLVPLSLSKYITMIFYMLGILLQIAGYCINGHAVLEQSLNICDGCYNMEWYRCDKPARKILFTIIERCKQPIVMRTGYIFNLSVITFTAILSKAYSCYAILSFFYNK